MEKRMAKLPEKNILSGSKTPKTTTGEMKDALGKLRDYLNDLLGDDSTDKEAARQALGIDLTELANRIEAKADQQAIEVAIQGKADKSDVESKIQELEEAIAKRGTPIGSIEYFAMAVPPAGYLKADGAAVGRETYPDLFDAIGTTFGEGDGQTTFNLPDLMDRFAQGSTTPGTKREAGVPDINGTFYGGLGSYTNYGDGAFSASKDKTAVTDAIASGGNVTKARFNFSAENSNSIFGASNTVQPPALTLLPCIKAFDAITNPGLIDVTALANEMAGKLDRTINGTAIHYVTGKFTDGTNWYRKWSDGWLEQGGSSQAPATLNFLLPFADTSYRIVGCRTSGGFEWSLVLLDKSPSGCNAELRAYSNGQGSGSFEFYACGQGAPS